MGTGKEKTLKKILPCRGNLSHLYSQDSTRPKHTTTGRIVSAPAVALGLCKPLVRRRNLLLAGQRNGFYRQFADSLLRMVGIGVEARKEAQSVAGHSAL